MLCDARAGYPFPFARDEVTAVTSLEGQPLLAIDERKKVITIGGLFVLLPESATVGARGPTSEQRIVARRGATKPRWSGLWSWSL